MDKKVIVITGASSGIGAALARQLGSAGHSLVLAARREKELREVAAASGPDAVPEVCDVTRRREVEHLRDRAIQSFGHVDVWVNNAGRGIARKVMELTDEDLEAMLNVNLKSALYGMQAIIPHFQERKRGHLINVSSFLGRVPMVAVRSAYNAAKAGLNALTANLRAELAVAYPDIYVSLVMPGLVSTDFGRNSLWATSQPNVPTSTPQAQTPEQVAQTIIDLMENPRPELYTNPLSHGLVKRYYEDVGAFERSMQRG